MSLPVKVYIYKDGNGDFNNSKFLFKEFYKKYIDYKCREYDYDYEIVINSFNLASKKENYENTYIIICKSSSVSACTSETISEIIEKVINENENCDNIFDIFYLSKWLDRCDQYTNIREMDSGLKIVNTYSPNGIQCIMFSPQGREKFLKLYDPEENPIYGIKLSHVLNLRIDQSGEKNVDINSDEVFIAITTTPSLINYDIVNCKGKKSNNLKLCECRDIPNPAKPEPGVTTSHMAFFWLIIIIIFVILITIVTVKYFLDKNKCVGNFCPSPPRHILPEENNLF
jgi:hypothetical protein